MRDYIWVSKYSVDRFPGTGVVPNMPRHFIILSNTVNCNKSLSLNNLTGFGRLDVLCRCITASFFLSNAFRKDTELSIFFRQNDRLLTITGREAEGINPDERSLAGVLKRVFKGKSSRGITFVPVTLEQVLTIHRPIILDIHGEKTFTQLDQPSAFFIGDQVGFTDADKQLFKHIGETESLSLGSRGYLSSQTITILNYLFDQTMK
jgi:tRNA (pseudouridine54-N1)-methyltransferase